MLRAQGVVGVLVVHGRGTLLLPPRCAATGLPPTVGRAAAVLYAQRTRDAASTAWAASPMSARLVRVLGQPKLANQFVVHRLLVGSDVLVSAGPSTLPPHVLGRAAPDATAWRRIGLGRVALETYATLATRAGVCARIVRVKDPCGIAKLCLRSKN